MDLSRTIIYRGFTLNDPDILTNLTPGSQVGSGISGCVVDSADLSDMDVVQFLEKRSLQDGMDAGDVYLGARRLRMAGTLYATTRALLYDAYQELRRALSPTLAQRESPADKGYLPLYFSVPTNDNVNYPEGLIDLRVLAMPRAMQAVFQKDNLGGDDRDALAIPWQATFIMRDPRIMSAATYDVPLTTTTEVACTVSAATDFVTKVAHGLANGDRVYFSALVGGAGLAVNTAYYVRNATADTFQLSFTPAGGIENVTTDGTAGTKYVKIVAQAGDLVNRGDYHAPLNALIVVGAQAGSIVMAIGGTTMTITVPASTGDRTIRYKGEDKVLTVEENAVEALRMDLLVLDAASTHPLVDGGTTPFTITVTGAVVKAQSHMWFWESFA